MQLSKSDYLLYLKQPAWLWLKKNDPKQLPKPDAALQAIFDAGFKFEAYAEQLFPDAVKLSWDGYHEYLTLGQRTHEAIEGGAKVILQAKFEALVEADGAKADIVCICDVVKFVEKDTVDLIEIKSSTGVRTYHEFDLAFQATVLELSGYKVRNISVMYVNKDYVRDGEVLPEDIVAEEDVTKHVKARLEPTKEHIHAAIKTMQAAEMPDPSPSRCGLYSTAEWTEIYKSLKGITKGDGSIYDIYNPNATLIGKLEESGIGKLAEIPEDFEGLSEKQRWQVRALAAGQPIVNKRKIKNSLNKIKYPIYFLDYETFAGVIPYFDGQKPFQQIPFQYSLHVKDSPDSPVRHLEFLHSDNSNPVQALSESLRQNIGPKGSVLVWWQDFEKGRNKEMGEMLPDFRDFYAGVNHRVIDLITPFFEYDYVDAGFGGSASIKDVLPVIAPELSYKDLGIQEGNAAQRLWMEAVLDGKHPKDKEKIQADLLKYCELDTLAMVKIWEFLEELTREPQQTLFEEDKHE